MIIMPGRMCRDSGGRGQMRGPAWSRRPAWRRWSPGCRPRWCPPGRSRSSPCREESWPPSPPCPGIFSPHTDNPPHKTRILVIRIKIQELGHCRTDVPRTLTPSSLAALMTGSNLAKLSSIEQLMFFLLKLEMHLWRTPD